MQKIIRYCCENHKVASFYHDENDTNAHLTGYVEQLNENEILIAHISAHGYYDGFIWLPIERIFRVDSDGGYEKKIEALYHMKKQTHDTVPVYEKGQSILLNLLRYAKEREFVVSMELEETVLSGIVEQYDDETVRLLLVNEYGVSDGVSVVRQDELLTVAVDTDDEQDMKLLLSQ